MPLTREQTDELRAILEQRRQALAAEIHEDVERVREEQFGELAGPAPDPGDESVADLISDMDQAEVSRDLGELRDVDAALARMQDGTYGECEACGGEIGYERLRASPTARRCVACQRLYEKTHASAAAPRL